MSKSKRRIRGMLIVLLAFIITLAAVVANVAFRRAVEEIRRTEVLLLQLQGLTYRLSALEWQAIGERGMSSGIVAGVQDTQDGMKRTMGSLEHRGFVEEIKQVIGIDANAPAGLELEITESVIMEDVKHNIASLQAIRAMGVTIAIDDFGTGFSSLAYLSKLPVDTLKIDRSFVIDMTSGPQGLALVSTIINLAHSLKLKVVAEGVETEEQSRLLRLLGCDEMQGFLFSKPVPGEIFETRFLASSSAGQ